jgi:hypothetical protein
MSMKNRLESRLQAVGLKLTEGRTPNAFSEELSPSVKIARLEYISCCDLLAISTIKPAFETNLDS